jgi:hypothetical protein
MESTQGKLPICHPDPLPAFFFGEPLDEMLQYENVVASLRY